jgi:isopentenyl-diphosphate delta-isomerase
VFQFTYRHEFENGLIENEYDHVFIGISDQPPLPDPAEVASFRHMDTDTLIFELVEQPDQYTAWFKICFEQVLKIYHQTIKDEFAD